LPNRARFRRVPRNIEMNTAPDFNLPTTTAATDPTEAAATRTYESNLTAVDYYELPTTVGRRLCGHSRGHRECSVHKLPDDIMTILAGTIVCHAGWRLDAPVQLSYGPGNASHRIRFTGAVCHVSQECWFSNGKGYD